MSLDAVASAFHQVDVFNRDRATVAIEHDKDGKSDGGFGGRNRQHEQREDLTDDVAHVARKGDKVDVDAEQDQLDRHQDYNHVLAVQKDPENAEREQDRGDRQIMS